LQVGYGDITPTNNLERFFSLFALLLGALVFGYMLSTIGMLFAAIDRQSALSEEKMDEVKEYMRWRKLPRELVLRMRRYYTYYYSRKTAFDEDAILGGLTPNLRYEVVRHTLKDSIGRIPLFRDTLEPLFQLEVFPLFKPMSAAPRDIIFSKGDPSDGLYFLVKGTIDVISNVSGFEQARVLYRIRQENHFGETTVIGRRRVATHRAVTPCEIYLISTEDLMKLFRRRPVEGKLIHAAVLREHVHKERLRGLSLRLLMNNLHNRPHDVAALKIQLAWGKYLDRAALGSDMVQALLEEEVDKLTTKDQGKRNVTRGNLKSAKSAKSAMTIFNETPLMQQPSSSSAEGNHHLDDLKDKLSKLDKLDRLDDLFEQMNKLVERVEKLNSAPKSSGGGSAPRSGGGRNARGGVGA